MPASAGAGDESSALGVLPTGVAGTKSPRRARSHSRNIGADQKHHHKNLSITNIQTREENSSRDTRRVSEHPRTGQPITPTTPPVDAGPPERDASTPVARNEITLEGPDDQIVVALAPRQLTEESAHEFRTLIATHLPNRDDGGLVIDMGEVYLISSVGITCLLEIREMCSDRRVGLRLAAMIDSVQQMLEMLRLTEKFEIREDTDTAIDDLVRESSDGSN